MRLFIQIFSEQKHEQTIWNADCTITRMRTDTIVPAFEFDQRRENKITNSMATVVDTTHFHRIAQHPQSPASGPVPASRCSCSLLKSSLITFLACSRVRLS